MIFLLLLPEYGYLKNSRQGCSPPPPPASYAYDVTCKCNFTAACAKFSTCEILHYWAICACVKYFDVKYFARDRVRVRVIIRVRDRVRVINLLDACADSPIVEKEFRKWRISLDTGTRNLKQDYTLNSLARMLTQSGTEVNFTLVLLAHVCVRN